jgi:hypothetical protein
LALLWQALFQTSFISTNNDVRLIVHSFRRDSIDLVKSRFSELFVGIIVIEYSGSYSILAY